MSGILITTYWREIVSIIEGGLKPDPYRVSSFAEHLAQRLENDGEVKLAQRIRRLTDGSSRPAGSTFVAQKMPSDIEAQQVLVEQIPPGDSSLYPVLPEPIDHELKRFVELKRRSGELEGAGIEPPSTMLLFGPPGCGKTMAAIAVAADLVLPLIVVRLDSLLGSFLGNSAKNLRRVFDSAMSKPCVLLLDEFDAIGKMRDDSQEVGEIKRLVSSLLQNLDRVQSGQIVIAATNHHHMLDPAVWRRFDVTLHLDKPNKDELVIIIRRLLPEDSLSKVQVDGLAILSCGLSGSEITTVIKRAIQDRFLSPKEPIARHITRGILARLKGFESSSYYQENKKGLILVTHQHTNGKLTIRQLARLVGCSAPYVHEVLRDSEGNGHDHRRRPYQEQLRS